MAQPAAAEVALGVLVGHDARVLREPDERLGLDRHAAAPGDVVQHHGKAGGVGDRGEVPVQALLRRLVVVRGDREKTVRTGVLGGAGQFDAVAGVVGADAGDDVGPVSDRVEYGSYELVFLRVAGGGRLARGAVDDEAVVAGVHQVGREPLGAVEVERAVRRERRDHRGEDPPEGGLRSGDRSHG